MARPITFTPIPFTVSIDSDDSFGMPATHAIDVSAFDVLDLMVGVLVMPGGGNVTVSFETSMQNQLDNKEHWIDMTPTGVFTAAAWKQVTLSNPLRFVRYIVSNSGDTGDVIFFIRGVARRLQTAG